MSTEIGQIKGVQAPATQDRERVTRSNGAGSRWPGGVTPMDGADAVSLSTDARVLLDVQQRLSEQPVVDQRRVETIRQAVSEGSYRIDVNRLAESLLAQERMLLAGGAP
jgi:negative regulator of flagellin synthesis FlgM